MKRAEVVAKRRSRSSGEAPVPIDRESGRQKGGKEAQGRV